jgi:hypothetical protein
MKRPKPKSRERNQAPRIVIRMPEPDLSRDSHTGGIFEEAGYSAGKGVFGFRQDSQ